MDYPPPPPPPPRDPFAPPADQMPASNIQPVAPPVPYQPPQAGYQPAPYGQPTQPYATYRLPKNKTTAVLLAIFLGSITWMYTYERDAWKFWLAFGVTLADIFLSLVTFGIWLFVAIPAGIGFWIWGIVDTAARPQQFYDFYPSA